MTRWVEDRTGAYQPREKADGPSPPECPYHSIHTNEETRWSGLFSCGGPLDVDAESVTQKSLGTIQTDATKVDNQEWQPFARIQESHPEGLFFQLMAGHTECDGSKTVKHNN